MIDASHYHLVYLLTVTVLTLVMAIRYRQTAMVTAPHGSFKADLPGYAIAIVMALFIGFRPLSGRYFVDMANYNDYYKSLFFGRDFTFDWDRENFIFDNMFAWMGASRYEVTLFFVVMAVLYFVGAYQAMTRFFPRNALYGFVVFLGAFSTFSYATNGLKAGVASSLFLCAVAYYRKPLVAVVLAAFSLGFHHSMVPPIAAFAIAYFVKNPKIYLWGWVLAFIMAMLHITYFQELFAGFSDEQGARYLNNAFGDWGGDNGFRLDFIIYSALPIAVGWWVIYRKKFKSRFYNMIFDTYVLTNAVWMLCMYASFTNRIAYLSWFLYPVVLVYPFFQGRFMPNQKRLLSTLVWFQLLFTLAMHFIYYG